MHVSPFKLRTCGTDNEFCVPCITVSQKRKRLSIYLLAAHCQKLVFVQFVTNELNPHTCGVRLVTYRTPESDFCKCFK